MESNYFEILNKINVNEKTEKKNNLTYLSWSWAWTEFLKAFPDATYEIKKDENGLPYFGNDAMGYMVYTTVTINGLTREMWLPVMDGANKAMKFMPYTYEVTKWEWNSATRKKEKVGVEKKTCDAADMFDVNKTIMRCLTKNLAMFGLGLYIYAGEDIPEQNDGQSDVPTKPQEPTEDEIEAIRTSKVDKVNIAAMQAEMLRTGVKPIQICKPYGVESINELTKEQFVKVMQTFSKTATKEVKDLGL